MVSWDEVVVDCSTKSKGGLERNVCDTAMQDIVRWVIGRATGDVVDGASDWAHGTRPMRDSGGVGLKIILD